MHSIATIREPKVRHIVVSSQYTRMVNINSLEIEHLFTLRHVAYKLVSYRQRFICIGSLDLQSS